jgi:hypothetical protein
MPIRLTMLFQLTAMVQVPLEVVARYQMSVEAPFDAACDVPETWVALTPHMVTDETVKPVPP